MSPGAWHKAFSGCGVPAPGQALWHPPGDVPGKGAPCCSKNGHGAKTWWWQHSSCSICSADILVFYIKHNNECWQGRPCPRFRWQDQQPGWTKALTQTWRLVHFCTAWKVHRMSGYHCCHCFGLKLATQACVHCRGARDFVTSPSHLSREFGNAGILTRLSHNLSAVPEMPRKAQSLPRRTSPHRNMRKKRKKELEVEWSDATVSVSLVGWSEQINVILLLNWMNCSF